MGAEETEAERDMESQRYPETERQRCPKTETRNAGPQKQRYLELEADRTTKTSVRETPPLSGPEGGWEPCLWREASRSRPKPVPISRVLTCA